MGHPNRTSLAIPIFEDTAALQAFRQANIHSPAAAMPPHVTIHEPVRPLAQLNYEFIERLATFFTTQSSWLVTFQDVGHFNHNGVLYLKPTLEQPFHNLRQALHDTFLDDIPPDPYPNRIFHLTIARYSPPRLTIVEQDFYQRCGHLLPLKAKVDRVCFYEKIEDHWQTQTEFLLGR
ncbi:MAG: 2'-5' RNA ligase family protein [Chloroflexota bacterium]